MPLSDTLPFFAKTAIIHMSSTCEMIIHAGLLVMILVMCRRRRKNDVIKENWQEQQHCSPTDNRLALRWQLEHAIFCKADWQKKKSLNTGIKYSKNFFRYAEGHTLLLFMSSYLTTRECIFYPHHYCHQHINPQRTTITERPTVSYHLHPYNSLSLTFSLTDMQSDLIIVSIISTWYFLTSGNTQQHIRCKPKRCFFCCSYIKCILQCNWACYYENMPELPTRMKGLTRFFSMLNWLV